MLYIKLFYSIKRPSIDWNEINILVNQKSGFTIKLCTICDIPYLKACDSQYCFLKKICSFCLSCFIIEQSFDGFL